MTKRSHRAGEPGVRLRIHAWDLFIHLQGMLHLLFFIFSIFADEAKSRSNWQEVDLELG